MMHLPEDRKYIEYKGFYVFYNGFAESDLIPSWEQAVEKVEELATDIGSEFDWDKIEVYEMTKVPLRLVHTVKVMRG